MFCFGVEKRHRLIVYTCSLTTANNRAIHKSIEFKSGKMKVFSSFTKAKYFTKIEVLPRFSEKPSTERKTREDVISKPKNPSPPDISVYYAVSAGHIPGIYWSEVLAHQQLSNYQGKKPACCRKYASLPAAEKFMKSKKIKKYYVQPLQTAEQLQKSSDEVLSSKPQMLQRKNFRRRICSSPTDNVAVHFGNNYIDNGRGLKRNRLKNVIDEIIPLSASPHRMSKKISSKNVAVFTDAKGCVAPSRNFFPKLEPPEMK